MKSLIIACLLVAASSAQASREGESWTFNPAPLVTPTASIAMVVYEGEDFSIKMTDRQAAKADRYNTLVWDKYAPIVK